MRLPTSTYHMPSEPRWLLPDEEWPLRPRLQWIYGPIADLPVLRGQPEILSALEVIRLAVEYRKGDETHIFDKPGRGPSETGSHSQ